jgi:hypothetical protein|tara:strand:- start:598 stop:756 length:159 start_codon:yes stop_codon:yes gene_type:complete
LALLAGNVVKTGNFNKPTNFESANSSQVRIETVAMQIFYELLLEESELDSDD